MMVRKDKTSKIARFKQMGNQEKAAMQKKSLQASLEATQGLLGPVCLICLQTNSQLKNCVKHVTKGERYVY